MLEQSFLTDDEYFSLHDTLTPARIAKLLDRADNTELLKGIVINIEEGMAQFADEDCLQHPMDRLAELATRVRGGNKLEVLAILAALSDLQSEFTHASEYGREELDKAIDAAKGALE